MIALCALVGGALAILLVEIADLLREAARKRRENAAAAARWAAHQAKLKAAEGAARADGCTTTWYDARTETLRDFHTGRQWPL